MKQHQQPAGGAPEVVNNDAQSRYELRIDGQVAAVAQYRLDGGTTRFTHTEVEPEYEGQGLASKLAAQALDDVRRRGHKVVAQCEFIAGYIARHDKEYGDLLRG
jgi:predicted GNAT family acetyltransferase